MARNGELLFAVPPDAPSALPSRTRIGFGVGGTAILPAILVEGVAVVGLLGLGILGLIRPGCGPPS